MSKAPLALLIANPPHPKPDATQAGMIFGRPTVEARIFLNCPAPVIWFMHSDRRALAEIHERLAHAGVRTTIETREAVTGLPIPERVRSFALASDRFTINCDDTQHQIDHSTPLVAIPCQPYVASPIDRLSFRQAARRANPNKSMRQHAKAALNRRDVPIDPSFLDLYFRLPSIVLRSRVVPGLTTFSGLGAQMQPNVRQNMAALLDALETLFIDFHVDRRLAAMPRVPTMTIDGISITTIRDEGVPLEEGDHIDLHSRLAWLTANARRDETPTPLREIR